LTPFCAERRSRDYLVSERLLLVTATPNVGLRTGMNRADD
jgi:hypothetical protein